MATLSGLARKATAEATPSGSTSRPTETDAAIHQRFTVAIPDLLEQTHGLSRSVPDWVSAEYPFVLSAGDRHAFTADTIRADLTDLQQRTEADELMLTTTIHDFYARRRSYALVAEEFDLSSDGP